MEPAGADHIWDLWQTLEDMLPKGCRLELYGPNVPDRWSGYMVSITHNGSFITGAHRTSIEGALHDLIAAMPQLYPGGAQ